MFGQLLQGSKRVLILLLIFLLVAWLIRTTPREQLIAALITLLAPFRIFRLPTNKIALRIELVLANLTTVQKCISETVTNVNIRKNSIKETATHLSGLYQKMVNAADQDPLEVLNITHQVPPVLKQWLLPLFLFIVLYLIHSSS